MKQADFSEEAYQREQQELDRQLRDEERREREGDYEPIKE
jgi:hypothetical protein